MVAQLLETTEILASLLSNPQDAQRHGKLGGREGPRDSRESSRVSSIHRAASG